MSENSKMKVCSTCGKEIAKSAKVCPFCGVKNKKPIYKRVWFWVLMVFLFFGIVVNLGGKSENTSVSKTTEETQQITYEKVGADKLAADLKGNAMNASETYKGKYLEITGKLNVIDAQGSYISIVDPTDSFAIIGVTCYIKGNEDVKNQIKGLSIGDTVTVKGKITDVGEVFGYSLTIDSVSK
jgi:hypothetical protein